MLCNFNLGICDLLQLRCLDSICVLCNINGDIAGGKCGSVGERGRERVTSDPLSRPSACLLTTLVLFLGYYGLKITIKH